MAKKRRQTKKKVRVAFRKNRSARTRAQNFTHQALDNLDQAADLKREERISGKGAVTRHRTVIVDEADDARIAVDPETCLTGRVLRAIGANHCLVQTAAGRLDCTVRRLVRTMARDARNAVVAGDVVLVRQLDEKHGVVERVEPRRSVLSRTSDRREHVIVANVDQALIVASVDQPQLKPALIDRFLVSAERGNVRGIVCLSKVDLVSLVDLQPLIGVYSRLGYRTVAVSTRTGEGLTELRRLLDGRETVVAGQSGVGKSSLINAIAPGLNLEIATVSEDTGKGRHTTRVAELLPLSDDTWIVDTPGIRQLELWAVTPEETEGYFIEFRPFVAYCRFPDCTHTHEVDCAVKSAVRQGLIARTRYHGYLRIVLEDD